MWLQYRTFAVNCGLCFLLVATTKIAASVCALATKHLAHAVMLSALNVDQITSIPKLWTMKFPSCARILIAGKNY